MDRSTYEQLDRIEENQEEIKGDLELIKETLGIKDSEEDEEDYEDTEELEPSEKDKRDKEELESEGELDY